MKKIECLNALEKLKDPDIKKREFDNLILNIETYIKSMPTPKPMFEYSVNIPKQWLLERVADDVYKGEIDGLMFRKIQKYIGEYENEK